MIHLTTLQISIAAFNIFASGYHFSKDINVAMDRKDVIKALVFGLLMNLMAGFIIWPGVLILMLVFGLAGWIDRLLSISYIWKYVIMDKIPDAGLIRALEFAETWDDDGYISKWNIRRQIGRRLIKWSIKTFKAKIESGKYNDRLHPTDQYDR